MRGGVGLPAMALSAMVQFSIAYCFGLLTFWFLEIQGFVILSMAVEATLGGQMFPLDLMPEPISPLFEQSLGFLVGLNLAKLFRVGLGLEVV